MNELWIALYKSQLSATHTHTHAHPVSQLVRGTADRHINIVYYRISSGHRRRPTSIHSSPHSIEQPDIHEDDTRDTMITRWTGSVLGAWWSRLPMCTSACVIHTVYCGENVICIIWRGNSKALLFVLFGLCVNFSFVKSNAQKIFR